MGYRINKLYIENFKSITKCSINLDNKDLVVLDGPNGFGKTTVFDAIEFILTGEIRRIKVNKISNGNKGYTDFLFAKNQDENTQVKIQLYNPTNKESLILAREVKPTSLTKLEKRPEEIKSTLHKLSDLHELVSEQNKVKKLTDITSIKEFYSLYNYIEQEESTHFLKNSEDNRVSLLSKLFNMEKETIERNKIKKARNILQKNILDKNNEMKKLETELKINEIGLEVKQTEYIQLLPNELWEIEVWDQTNPLIESIFDKKNYFKKMDIYGHLNTNFIKFKSYLMNRNIKGIMESNLKLHALLVIYNLKGKIPEITKEYLLKEQFKSILLLLYNKDLMNPKLNWELIKQNFNFNYKELDLKLKQLRNLTRDSDELNKLLINLLSSRKMLMEKFRELKSKHKETDIFSECPLCGRDWRDYENVLKNVEEQTNFLNNKLDVSAKEIDQLLTGLHGEIIVELIQQIEDRLEQMISEGKYKKIFELSKIKINYEGVERFFETISLDFKKYLYTTEENYDDLDERVFKLSNELNAKIEVIEDFDWDHIDEMEYFYKEVCKSNDELLKRNLERFTEENIEKKKAYLTNLFISNENKKNKKLTKLKCELRKKTALFEKFDRALNVYNKNIANYRMEMVKEIEIPFYIYTGKIIQNYQRGIGVFLREDKSGNEGLKALRFIPQVSTDHDIIHTFSSGQLAGTILAFTLALNKVFNSSLLDTLLIDDPMQTMDEINMASFIELIRNEFGNQQIIFSTHDSQTSLYARYKYSKYGHDTLSINVKDTLYNL